MMFIPISCRSKSFVVAAIVAQAAMICHADEVRFDFESGTAEGWRVVEGNVGRFVCDRPNWYDGKPFGKQGTYFLSTIESPSGPWSDGYLGVAESPVFVPSSPEMSFLLGGGNRNDVHIGLYGIDGKELVRATGPNSHVMRRVDWSVPEAVGKPVLLRLVDAYEHGYGWLIFDDFRAQGRIDEAATQTRILVEARKARRLPVDRLLSRIDLDMLRRMMVDLSIRFGARFPEEPDFLRQLEEHAATLKAVDEQCQPDADDAVFAEAAKKLEEIAAFQCKIALAHPLLRSQPILFVVREQYASDHHNTETIFHTGEPNCRSYRPGGPLKFLDPKTGHATVLLDPGPEGLIRDPEVHFDGHRVIFSMRKTRDENYSIYELDTDPANGYAMVPGSLHRLTAEPDATDIDPCYLPDGRIIFSSTREPKYCHCNMHIMANLYRMDGDGANIHQIGKSTLFEGHASLLPDGRVLYYRWEYVDRNYGDAQGLWTVNPDGTNHAIYWGNNTVSPAAVFDGRAIPGTDTVACIFGSCHDRPWGAMAVVDRGKGIDNQEAVVIIWPESARRLVSNDGSDLYSPFSPDQFRQMRSRYEDPYPLTDPATGKGGTYFLVSRSITPLPPGQPVRSSDDLNGLQMGIYLVDTSGKELLLHAEEPGCFDPMPLTPHQPPPVIQDRRDYTSPAGTIYVTDVYQGTHMKGVKCGEVAALRVVGSREKRFWTGPLWYCAQYATSHRGRTVQGDTLNRPAVSWAGFEVKEILGTVPVEADGSACFNVPAERFVYFQLLDRNGMMISTMRSGTEVQPGETLGCVGCHENRLGAPPPGKTTIATQRAPDTLDGWYGPARPFGYVKEVQPVWDAYCVRCHDFGKKAGKRLVLAGDNELVFNASYVELSQNWGKEGALLNTVGLGLAPLNEAYAVGSHRSRLVDLLRQGHQDVTLPAEAMDRIVTWIDIGGPYYPDFACAHPTNVAGRAPLTIPQAKRLGELTGVSFFHGTSSNPGFYSHTLQISFSRPELSPCLTKLDPTGAAYVEALAMIKAGQAELEQKPEAGMPGFTYCPEHQAREDKYQKLKARECERRNALAKGNKVYDVAMP